MDRTWFYMFLGHAQTKGTSALSLGVNINSFEAGNAQSNTNEQKSSSYTLGYGNIPQDLHLRPI